VEIIKVPQSGTSKEYTAVAVQPMRFELGGGWRKQVT